MKRPLWIVSGTLLGASVALWGSSRLVWATETRRQPGTDVTTVVARTGGEVRPLVPLAVLALAGVAAAVALGGWPRRVLGVLFLAVAALVSGYALAGVPGGMPDFPWGRWLAGLAAALLAVASVLLVRFAGRMPRLGAAYRRPNDQRRSADSDEELWRALSLGKDPTTDDL